MMIKQLELNNFQSHKETVLEFAPGVNVIIGPSDSGKTAILRALHWLAWNRPLGDAFRSSWGGDTSILARFNDCDIERFKGKEDHYKLWYDPPEEPIEFKAFGTEVPEEIIQALNLSEINIQHQMDSPFLIADNPGQVARHFNKVANIDDIDSSQKNVESWIRSINSDIKAAEEEIQRHQAQLDDFKYLDKLEAEVEVLEQLDSKRSSKHSEANKIGSLLSDIENVSTEIESKSKLLPLESLVNEVISLWEEEAEKTESWDQLSSLISKIRKVEEELEVSQEILEDKDLVESTLSLYNNKKQVTKDRKKVKGLVMKIQLVHKKLDKAENKLEKLETKWHKHAPETCPLCNGTGKLIK